VRSGEGCSMPNVSHSCGRSFAILFLKFVLVNRVAFVFFCLGVSGESESKSFSSPRQVLMVPSLTLAASSGKLAFP